MTSPPNSPDGHTATQIATFTADAALWFRNNLTESWSIEELRTPALRPWAMACGRKEVVESVCHARMDRLARSPWGRANGYRAFDREPDLQLRTRLFQAATTGRLLAYEPDVTLMEGLPASETYGFLDSRDCPPWDLRAGWFHDGPRKYLVAWVPRDLVSLVDQGIAVSTTNCLWWLDSEPNTLWDQLQAYGMQIHQ